jgi:hypothetical protein
MRLNTALVSWNGVEQRKPIRLVSQSRLATLSDDVLVNPRNVADKTRPFLILHLPSFYPVSTPLVS